MEDIKPEDVTQPMVAFLVATEASARMAKLVVRNLAHHGIKYKVFVTCDRLYDLVLQHGLAKEDVAYVAYPRYAPELHPVPHLLWQIPHSTLVESVLVLTVPFFFNTSPQLIFDAVPESIGLARIGYHVDFSGKEVNRIPPLFLYRRSLPDIWKMEGWLQKYTDSAAKPWWQDGYLRLLYPMVGLEFQELDPHEVALAEDGHVLTFSSAGVRNFYCVL